MNKVTVFDVANYIINKIGTLTAMKLQKLVYYSQVWSVIWDENELFNEEIQAWANGPVVKELYNEHKGEFRITKEFARGNKNKLSKNQKENINKVLDFYGKKSAQWLSELTHNELPWILARKGLQPDERGERVINLASIQEYYSSL